MQEPEGLKCENCGRIHQNGIDDMGFKWIDQTTSRLSCPYCGTYTLQKAFDRTFTAGYFLVVRSKLKRRGLGK